VSLLLKVFQSVDERAPVVVVLAIFMANTQVVLLYVIGQRAERLVRAILLATTHERVFMVPLRVFTVPEREVMLAIAVVRVPERVFTDHETELIEPFNTFTLPESVTRFPLSVLVVVIRPVVLPERLARLPLRLVFDPWSFWKAERVESLEVTTQEPETNPVRREEIDLALVK
jgi:hypothetical protein